VAEVQNVNQVALECGNSSSVIFKHYRELVRPAEATKWFSIQPPSGGEPASQGKIVPIPTAGAEAVASVAAGTE
jgi:hypothetical protein